jgi:cytochrome c553
MKQLVGGGLGALLLSASLMGASHAAGDPAKGREKSLPCMGCHGIPTYTFVYPSYRVPKLAGQHADYLVAALKAYKSAERQQPTMQAQASSLSEQDMADLAAFFSSLNHGSK